MLTNKILKQSYICSATADKKQYFVCVFNKLNRLNIAYS
ncbi:hypothetical protein GARC_4005 [Paraglaciecola arctica BSs20135]|uniref:Uncharacterized protein n=1 Tax=Paraglaciecola arctica BSs20135 TaxID=493475 RepID=K6YS17_9ALTE|nr:hypothetical protein GARC_4005 [Paraglaciecola arctica BSs20135]